MRKRLVRISADTHTALTWSVVSLRPSAQILGYYLRLSATSSIQVSQSHCLVIILKSFAVMLLLKTPIITVESTQNYKTCIRHHLNIRCRMIDSWPVSSFKQSGNYTHHIAVISKVCILHVVCFSVPYYSHDKQLYFPIHGKMVGLHTRSPEYLLRGTIRFCVQLRRNSLSKS